MAPVTEIATFPLAAGATIEDANSPAGKVWRSALDTVSAQDGFQKAYYGREVEDPSVLQFFVGRSETLTRFSVSDADTAIIRLGLLRSPSKLYEDLHL